MFNQIKDKKFLPYLVLSPVISVFLFLLPIEHGLEISIACCFISFITTLIFYRHKIKWNNYKTIYLCYLLFASYAEIWHPDGYKSEELRTLAYFSLFIFTVPKNLLNFSFLKKLIIIANISLFIHATYQYHFLGIHRIQGFTASTNLYAIACAVLPLLLLVMTLLEKKKTQFIMLLVFLANLSPLLYTQSRGGWLAFFCGFIILIVTNFKFTQKSKSKVLILLLIIFSASYLTTKVPILKNRHQLSIHNINEYQKGNPNTSIGMRLELWKAALYTLQKQGIWGAPKKHHDNLKELYKNGIISEYLHKRHFNHYHNYYLTILVKYGVIGLSLWLLLALYPLIYTVKNFSNNPSVLLLAILPPTVYLTAALVDNTFGDIRVFVLYIIISYLPFLLKENNHYNYDIIGENKKC